MELYNVKGMSCAACSARVEKAVSEVDGVTSCSVSLLTNSMGVEGTAGPDAVISAVRKAGYDAALKSAAEESSSADSLEDTETPVLKKRLIASIVFLCALMYFSMGHMMWGWPLPPALEGNHVAMGLIQMLLAAAIMVINQRFFISGYRALANRAPNMDTLVSLGATASFAWSVYILFLMTGAVAAGDTAAAAGYMDQFYFESAGMILTLITVGKMLEARSKGRTTDALKNLIKLTPKTAVLLTDAGEVTVPAEKVKAGDIFLVRPGDSIPVDGTVIEGLSSVNEAALTGESVPVDKAAGDSVSAGTINQTGFLKCSADRVGEDTTLSRIIKMVSDASATKAPIARIADRVSGVFVPTVITIAVITVLVWLFASQPFGYALARGISVLVISCPCALGLATPVAIMVGTGVGAKNGILFKTSASLEMAGRISAVVLDKTGTITMGDPSVSDIIPAEGVSEEELLTIAASAEQMSEHPFAKAIVNASDLRGFTAKHAEGFEAKTGSGIVATVEGSAVRGGSLKYMCGHADVTGDLIERADRLSNEGKTPLLFSEGGRLLGIIAVSDPIKDDSAEAVKELKGMGIRTVMLTGDNRRTAEAIGKEAGVDMVIAGVMPDEKEQVIRRLSEKGHVAMVGDGINDAPALARADLGIAIGAGSDIAIDAADIVLIKSSLKDVSAAIRLGRATLRNIRQNLFWAFIYNVIGIPLAAGVWIPVFGWTMNPMIGALAMSLSSFCVVTNALRLNLVRVHDPSRDKRLKQEMTLPDIDTFGKGDTKMKKTVFIEGMMCEHCEARVKKTLEGLDGVTAAEVSHEKGTAVLSIDGDISDDAIKTAVEAQDYKVTGIE